MAKRNPSDVIYSCLNVLSYECVVSPDLSQIAAEIKLHPNTLKRHLKKGYAHFDYYIVTHGRYLKTKRGGKRLNSGDNFKLNG